MACTCTFNSHSSSSATHRTNITPDSRNKSSQGIHNCDIVFLVIWLVCCFVGVGVAGFYAGKLATEVIPFLAFPLILVALFVVFLALLFTILIMKRKMSCLNETNVNRRTTTLRSNAPPQPQPQQGFSQNVRGLASYQNTQQPPRNAPYSTVYGHQRSADMQASSLSCTLPREPEVEDHDNTLPSYDDVIRKNEIEESV